MAGNITKIKRQLRSVKSTKKLTNAMLLVATAKLQKERGRLFANNSYAGVFEELLYKALCAKFEGEETNKFLVESKVDNPLHIVFTSNSGLCGGYNMELLKFVEANVSKQEPIFAIGTYGIRWLMSHDFMVVKQIDELNDFHPATINKLIDDIMKLYQNDEISSIDIYYTDYVNTLKYEPRIYPLLPIRYDREVMDETDMLLEPSRDEVLDKLIPLYVSSQIYEKFLESKISENAARRIAMDGANKNADSLISDLQIRYNQARQGAITQEMNEITSSSLK